MLSKKFKAQTWGEMIEPITIDRETSTSVWVYGRRHSKISSTSGFFDSFQEAKDFLTGIAESRLNSARQSLQAAQGFAGNVKGLKP